MPAKFGRSAYGVSSRLRVLRAVAMTAAITPLLATSAMAGNAWDGGGSSNNWSDSANWSPDGAPGYGTLTFTGSNRTTNNNDSIGSMNQLLWTGSSAWTLTGSTTLSLFDFSGGAAKIENQSSGLVTISAPITFAANNGSPPNPFGEINAVNGDLTFSGATLTVNGSSVNGIKLFGGGRVTTFNNTVSASGKYFGTTAVNTTLAIGGTFTSGDLYVMNGGTLNLTGTGSTVTTSAVRLGGDFGNTGQLNPALGGTLKFSNAAGGIVFGNVINAVSGNTSGALAIVSQNSGGSTNQITGSIFLDSSLAVSQVGGGTLRLGATDVKAQTLTLTPASGGTIRLSGVVSNSVAPASGATGVLVNGAGTVELASASTYSGDTVVTAGKFNFADPAANLANSTIRLGATSGSTPAEIGLAPATGGVSISSVINPRAGGTGALSIASQNTSGSNTLSGHIGLDRELTISQSAGGTLNLTATRSGITTNTGYDIKGYQFTLSSQGTLNVSGTVYNSTGSGSVRADGSGVVVMSGANSYAGGTTIAAGTLRANHASSSFGTGTTTVTGGTLAGTGATGGAVVLNSGGRITAGDGANATDAAGTLTTGNQTWNGGGTYAAKFKTTSNGGSATANGTSWDKLSMGTLTLSANVGTGNGFTIQIVPSSGGLVLAAGQQFQIATFTNALTQAAIDAAITLAYDNVTVSNGSSPRLQIGSGGTSLMLDTGGQAAPEPATAMLVGLGGVAVMGRRKKRR